MMLPQIPWIEWIATLAVGISSFSRVRHIRMVSMIALVLAVAVGMLRTAGGFSIVPAAGAVAAFFVSPRRLWLSLVARMTAADMAGPVASIFWMFPVPAAPTPGGPFKVGTRIIEIPEAVRKTPGSSLKSGIRHGILMEKGCDGCRTPPWLLAFHFTAIGSAKILALIDAPDHRPLRPVARGPWFFINMPGWDTAMKTSLNCRISPAGDS